MSDTPRTDAAESWGTPQYCEHITFEGCDCAVMPPEEYEALFEHARTLERELAAVTAERDALRDVLRHSGFVPCDIFACNCGSWHPRYGLYERMQEIKEALAEAGHEMSNENGHSPLKALKQLIAELESLREAAQFWQYIKENHLQTCPHAWLRTGDDLEEAVRAAIKARKEKP